MNKLDAYLTFKQANGIHEPTFKDEAHTAPPQGRTVRAVSHKKSTQLYRPPIVEGEYAHLMNRKASENSKRGWAGLTPEQRAARVAMNREAARKSAGKKRIEWH
jgi:hypothetical protein